MGAFILPKLSQEDHFTAYVFFNNNPSNKRVGDCAVRAVSKAVGQDWTDAYIGLCAEGLAPRDMPSSNYV